jgi:hypothetical protein
VEESLELARTLSYPFSVLPMNELRRMGRLRAHEEMRSKLVMVDEYKDLVLFAQKCPFTTFVSHQWLGTL